MKNQIYVLLAALLWGTTGSAQALAPTDASPLAIGAFRMLIGGSILFIIAIIKNPMSEFKTLNYKKVLKASFAIGLFQPFFFLGIQITGIALGTVVAIGSSPIFSGIIELLEGKKISKVWLVATTFSIVGCIMLFTGKSDLKVNFIGILFSLFAGLLYALYVKFSKVLLNSYSRDIVNGTLFLLSGIILSPILFFVDISWVTTYSGSFVVIYLGIATTTIAYTLFSKGLKNIEVEKAVSLTLAEPLTAALLGIFIFKEQLSFFSMIGLFLLFIGLVINSVFNKNTEENTSKIFLKVN
ncbi:EamA family transporter [Clostridiaceae bacterium HSG29]|nr:EamA family transporter [Clostridiaceae bacterium HSG29]